MQLFISLKINTFRSKRSHIGSYQSINFGTYMVPKFAGEAACQKEGVQPVDVDEPFASSSSVGLAADMGLRESRPEFDQPVSQPPKQTTHHSSLLSETKILIAILNLESFGKSASDDPDRLQPDWCSLDFKLPSEPKLVSWLYGAVPVALASF